MTVLTIIGMVIAAALIYWFILYFNEFTSKRFRYTFFNLKSFVPMFISYLLLFFGENWFRNAVNIQGDTLNGLLLIALGILILYYVIYQNFKRTNFLVGVFGTMVQLFIYVIFTFLGFFALIALLAYLAQTRPVIRIN